MDPEEEFWDDLAIDCGFSALAATSRFEFINLVKMAIAENLNDQQPKKETK
jgi:hypothetical protein